MIQCCAGARGDGCVLDSALLFYGPPSVLYSTALYSLCKSCMRFGPLSNHGWFCVFDQDVDVL